MMAINQEFYGLACEYEKVRHDDKVIMKDAFAKAHGKKVPIFVPGDLYIRGPETQVGEALLENTQDGIVAHFSFEDCPLGQMAHKVCALFPDDVSVFVFANKLTYCETNKNLITSGEVRCIDLIICKEHED